MDQNVRYFRAAYGIGSAGRAGELIERLGYAACRGQRAHPVGRDPAETEPDPGPHARPPVLLPRRALRGLRLADLPRLLELTAELRERARDGGHQPPGLRARAFRRICHLTGRRIYEKAGSHAAAVDTAIRLSLAGQVRNRFAWILLVAFVPVVSRDRLDDLAHRRRVPARATGATVTVDGHDLALITAGLSSVTLITGFVVFAAVRRARAFDRRLVLSGYRPPP